MGAIRWLLAHLSPIFIVSSPITSYADQIWTMHKTKSSAGFSLDLPLIMLVASILKLYYWLGARYDNSLLAQAGLMVISQSLLLHVGLTNRPSAAILSQPFGGPTNLSVPPASRKRPYGFWQWRSQRPYWQFLAGYILTLLALQVLIGASRPWFVSLQGYVALGIEATLPLPQILSNQRNASCKGFRLSVLANWLVGDLFKMAFFFYISQSSIPWAFKACGIFQACCDVYLGVQYLMFGNGPAETLEMGEKMDRLS